MAIRYIFVVTWYIFPILVCCTRKTLATLVDFARWMPYSFTTFGFATTSVCMHACLCTYSKKIKLCICLFAFGCLCQLNVCEEIKVCFLLMPPSKAAAPNRFSNQRKNFCFSVDEKTFTVPLLKTHFLHHEYFHLLSSSQQNVIKNKD
jgi:hypothetical protein